MPMHLSSQKRDARLADESASLGSVFLSASGASGHSLEMKYSCNHVVLAAMSAQLGSQKGGTP
jgi:hypothetical protein